MARDHEDQHDRTSDTADHLMEDTEGEQYGTPSTREAIERGFAYHPPDEPAEERQRSGEQT